MEIEIDIIRLKDKALSPAASAFVNFLRERSDPEDLIRMADRMGEWGIGPLPAASQQTKERLHLVEGSAAPKPAYLYRPWAGRSAIIVTDSFPSDQAMGLALRGDSA